MFWGSIRGAIKGNEDFGLQSKVRSTLANVGFLKAPTNQDGHRGSLGSFLERGAQGPSSLVEQKVTEAPNSVFDSKSKPLVFQC